MALRIFTIDDIYSVYLIDSMIADLDGATSYMPIRYMKYVFPFWASPYS